MVLDSGVRRALTVISQLPETNLTRNRSVTAKGIELSVDRDVRAYMASNRALIVTSKLFETSANGDVTAVLKASNRAPIVT